MLGGSIAGVLFGGALGLVTGTIVVAVVGPDCQELCDEDVEAFIMGGQLGYGLSAGVTLVGNHPGGSGSYGSSLLGAAIGGGVAVAMVRSDALVDSGVFGVSYFVLPLAGALLGYWSSHQHTDDSDDTPAVGALLRLHDGHVDLGIPAPVPLGQARTTGLVLAAGSF